MTREEIKKILKEQKVTYVRITANYCQEKSDLYQIRITFGGNLIKFLGPTTSTTVYIITSNYYGIA